MALNTHALRFVESRQMRVSLDSTAREKCSIRGIDQFTFEAHVKVGAGAVNLQQRAYVETQGTRDKIRFACTPTKDSGRSVLVFEFARNNNASPTSYRYEIPNGWDDRWHHVAFSVNIGDSKYAIYFDNIKVREGSLVGGGKDSQSRALLIDKTVPKEVVIGASPKGSNDYVYWDGKIDNIRLFRKSTTGTTYDSEDHPVFDHCPKVGQLAKDIDLIEEWRFNEGPRGSDFAKTYGVVDHQYDPKLKADEYAEQDNPSNNNNQETNFTPGDPQIMSSTLYEGSKTSNNLWIGIDVVESLRESGIVVLPKDFDRPFIGEAQQDTTPPNVPTNLKTTAVTEDSFEASWRGVIDDIAVQDYQIDVSTVDSFETIVYSRKVGRRTTELVPTLRPGLRYFWRVRAIDAETNESAWASSTAYPAFVRRTNSRVNYSTNPSFEGLRHTHAWQPYAEAGVRPSLSIKAYGAQGVRPENNTALYGDHHLVVARGSGIAGLNNGAAHIIRWDSGDQMTCSFWVRGSGTLAVFYQQLCDFSSLKGSDYVTLTQVANNQSGTSYTLTDQWTRLSFTVTPNGTNMNRVRILFVCPNTGDYTFDLDGVLVEKGSQVGSYFDGSHKGTLTEDAYWAVFDESASDKVNDGYIVGPSNDTSLSFTDESISVYNVEVMPISAVQTLDFTDRVSPNPPSTESVSHSAAADIGFDSFIAKWKAPTSNFEDIVAYELQVGLKSNLSARDVVFVPGYELLRIYDAPLDQTGTFTRTIRGLAPQTAYYYRVRAVDANGNLSDWSSQNASTTLGKLIVTEARPDTTKPSDVVAEEPTDITFDSFMANWQASIDDVGVVGYRLTVARDSAFSDKVSGFNDLEVGNVLSYEVTGLQEDTEYFYRLRAYDAAGNVSNVADGVAVSTLGRPEELGGYVTQGLGLESLVPISSVSTTTAYNESSVVRLDGASQALLQFKLHRAISPGEIKSTLLNLTRYVTNNPFATYTLTALSDDADPLTALYTPATVTYGNKPADASPLVQKAVALYQPTVGGSDKSVVTLDVTDLVAGGAKYYGFRMQVTQGSSVAALGADTSVQAMGSLLMTSSAQADLSAMTFAKAKVQPEAFSVVFAGTLNDVDYDRPELSIAVDTSSVISVARARTTSEPALVQNLFSNPTFDSAADDFPIANASFELSDTTHWLAEVESASMQAELSKSTVSYDSVGGSGQLEITSSTAPAKVTDTTIISQTRILAIPGVEYRARAFLATTNTDIRPRMAILRYRANGSLIDKVTDVNQEWTPSANVWYQRELSYAVSENDSETKWLQIGFVIQTREQSALGIVRFDAVSMTSSATTTPLYVEELFGADAARVFDSSFDEGIEETGAALRVLTKPTSSAAVVGAGVRLRADVPVNESWLTAGYGNSTVNLVENPSFEAESLSHVTTIGTGTTKTRSLVNGARGTYALAVSSSALTHGVSISSAHIPTYYGTTELPQRSFVGSCWVLGGYTYSAKLVAIYSDNSETIGTERLFTVAENQWQRLTLSSDLPIAVASVESESVRLKRVELRIQVTLAQSPASAVTWYVDGVQIEPALSTTAMPTAYCDGDQTDAYWYGQPHASLSFRHAFMSSYRLNIGETVTNLASRLRLVLKDNSVIESPQTLIGTLPADGGWVPIRTWPVALLGATSSNYPVRLELDIYTTSAVDRTLLVDAVQVVYNDPATTSFNGSTLKGVWRRLPFSSASEHSGVRINARVHTRGSLYNTGSVRTWFRLEGVPDMGYQSDDGITARYERDARYIDVRMPDRLRWNEAFNPSFELGAEHWLFTSSQFTTALSASAARGAAVGVWTIGDSPSSATLKTGDLVPAQAGDLWTFQIQVRAPQITRTSAIRGRVGLIFYDAGGAVIGTPTDVSYASAYPFELSSREDWATVVNSAVAPAGTRWVRGVVLNVPVGNSYGLLTGDVLEFDTAMFYRGEQGRYYLDGDNATHVRWEGRRHRSPSIFVINGGEGYWFRYMADAGDGVLLGDPIEQYHETVRESTDYVEFLFDQHTRTSNGRMIELTIPYRGANRQRATLTGTYRRVDTYERMPLFVEINETRGLAYVRADGLAQNREYVFEIDVVAPDPSRLRGDNRYVTRAISGTQTDRSTEATEDGLIQFGGFTLNGPGSTFYYVTEHDAFSMPERRTQIESVPRADGGIELQAYWGTKTISLSGGVWGNTRAELYNNVNALRAALMPKRQKLRIDTLANNNDYYWATCTGFTTKEVAGESIYGLSWSASFECADPFLYRGEAQSVTFDIVSSKPTNTVDFFYTDDQRFTVVNNGSVYAMPKMVLSTTKGSGDYSVAFVNETTGERVMPKAVVNRNDSVEIDTQGQTCIKNGAIILDYVGTFPRLAPGPNVIRASIRDLKSSRHNLLLNPGVEDGPAIFSANDDEGIRPGYTLSASNTPAAPWTKNGVAGVTVTRNRFQVANNSNYSALVELDGKQEQQGVVFRTRKNLSQERFTYRPTKSRAFTAAAYVRTDETGRQLDLNNCFIRIWYTDGSYQDEATTATGLYRLQSQWKLIQLPKLTSQDGKAINYVEVVFRFRNRLNSATSFLIDNVFLTQDDLTAEQIEAAFQLTVTHQERFI